MNKHAKWLMDTVGYINSSVELYENDGSELPESIEEEMDQLEQRLSALSERVDDLFTKGDNNG